MRYYLGIDIGSSSTKAILIDSGANIISKQMILTKPSHTESSDIIHRLIRRELASIDQELASDNDNFYCVGTGYGRNNIDVADKVITEITCHAKGAVHCFPQARTIIDIGGQDSKIIAIDETGQVDNFIMNEKCAAGTGRFLELASKILKIPIEEFGQISLKSKDICTISRTCVVFAESEIISKLAEGVGPEAILRGIHFSIVSRLLGMGKRLRITPPIAFTGGLAENMGIVEEIITQLHITTDAILVPTDPIFTGALGAALFASEESPATLIDSPDNQTGINE